MTGPEPSFSVTLPADVVEQLAARAAELAVERLAGQLEGREDPWMNVAQAAAYLACPRSRIYDLVRMRRADADGREPRAGVRFATEGSRLMFRREWLDETVRECDRGVNTT